MKFLAIILLLVFCILIATSSSTLVNAQECSFPSQRVQCGALTCNSSSGQCIPCANTSQCWDDAMYCGPSHTPDHYGEMECLLLSYKDLFTDRPGGLVGACLVAVGICAIAVLGGVGGGGILVPLYQVLMGVPLLDAVGLSQATIVGQSVFNVLLQVWRYHPQYQPPRPTRPVVNYPLLVFWLPISLVGTMWGNLVGKMVPDWFRMVLLFLLLSYALKRMVDRMIKQKKEDDAKKAAESRGDTVQNTRASAGREVVTSITPVSPDGRDDDDEDRQQQPLLGSGSSSPAGSLKNLQGGGGIPLALKQDPRSAGMLSNEEDNAHAILEPAFPQFPPLQYILVLLTFAPLLVANVAKNRWVTCQENLLGFWGVTIGVTIYNLAVALGYRNYLSKLNDKITSGEEDPELIPFRWNNWTTIYFPLISVTAGAAASLLGIGGGLILSFLFLEAGLVPEEASATSGFATFAVALESLIQFVIQGAIRWDYFLVFFCCGLCATMIGQKLLMPIIKARGWRFLIVGSLAFIMAASMLALTAVGIYDTVKLLHHGGSVAFGELCPMAYQHHTTVNHGGGG